MSAGAWEVPPAYGIRHEGNVQVVTCPDCGRTWYRDLILTYAEWVFLVQHRIDHQDDVKRRAQRRMF